MSNPHPRPRLSPDVSIQVIEALGGYVYLADLCGITREAVLAWKKRGISKPRMLFLFEKFRGHPVMRLPEVVQLCGG